MIPAIIKLRGDVNELQERVLDLQAKAEEQHTIIEIQQGAIELLTMRGDMMAAHVENLIERVAALEPGDFGGPCTCGYGGQHEPANPRCLRNQRAEMRAGGEIEAETTSTDTPVSPSPADGDKNPAGW